MELNIKNGDLVDFGIYGELYVCNSDYTDDYYWVTDDKSERYNNYANGWSIPKYDAVEIIKKGKNHKRDNMKESIKLNERNSPKIDTFKVDVEALANDIYYLADDLFEFYYVSGNYYGAEFELITDDETIYYNGYQSESGEFVMRDESGHEIWGNKPSDFFNHFKKNVLSLNESYFDADNLGSILVDLGELLRKKNLYFEIDVPRGSEDSFEIHVEDGDWKHEHAYLDNVVKNYFNSIGYNVTVNEIDVEDSDTDSYTSTHVYTIK